MTLYVSASRNCLLGAAYKVLGHAAHAVVVCALLSGSAWANSATTSGQRQAYRLQLYQVLVAEIAAREGDATSGYTFMIEAAKSNGDPALFERAVEIAVATGSGALAWEASSLWTDGQPNSLEAQRAMLRVALALGREQSIVTSLQNILKLSPAESRLQLIRATPATLLRLPANTTVDPVRVVRSALAPFLADSATTAAVYAAIGFVQLNAKLNAQALDSAQLAQQSSSGTTEGARLALALLDQGTGAAEPLLLAHLNANPTSVRIRFGYARALLNNNRTVEALSQAELVAKDDPNFAPALLLLGRLLLDQSVLVRAQHIALGVLNMGTAGVTAENERVTAQALFLLADVAQARQEWQAASNWLDQASSPEDMPTVVYKRAVLLGKQGFEKQGFALLDTLAQDTPQEVRLKMATKVQWLREFKQYEQAYQQLLRMGEQFPNDPDLMYEQAMLAEQLGNHDDMERLLRLVIQIKPDFDHAYNALGYSLADRGERLPEAIALIQQALALTPNDPYMTDSLGWAYFRNGQLQLAEEFLRKAYAAKADAEIAAHLGDVLWHRGKQDEAKHVWRAAASRHMNNKTLNATMQRFGVEP
ncbi:tetratricopeptide repeat protein [Betaproteobacteria bacterium MOLA814]|nr:tetratricopeptide repeat protein [Betaproteobacteria bacterium MOLA814]